MTRPEIVTTAPSAQCARGCIKLGRHVTDCEDRDACRGCFPRPAEFGSLCESCHLRLAQLLQQAPGQHSLLMSTLLPASNLDLTAHTEARIPDGWRTSDAQSQIRAHASGSTSSPQEGEPLRLACLDVAQELADLLSTWVERLVDEHDLHGPARLSTSAEGRGEPNWKWSPMVGDFIDAGTPARFTVPSASRWLLAQIGTLNRMPGIADDMEVAFDIMARAHALAPWREQSKRLRGLPCPDCHRVSLQIFGGEDCVRCTTPGCNKVISHGRYLLWARMYEAGEVEAG